MTNEERQNSLNKKMKREDLGVMPYCDYCNKKYLSVNIEEWGCWATQADRTGHCLCAKAYNRMKRRGGNG